MAYTSGLQFKNISGTPRSFDLDAGQYAIQMVATWGGGNVQLQRLSSDGTTYVSCMTARTANGYDTVNIPDGTYKLAVTTATGVYVDIAPVVKA